MGLIVKRRVTLDLSRRGHQVTVPFSVGDRVAHEVIFTLRDGSELVELPPGVTAAITVKNGYKNGDNGTGCVDACVIDHVNNTITYTPTEEALSIEGNIECSLQVFDADGAKIGSPTFIFAVSEGDNANTETEVKTALESSSGWDIIAKTVSKAQDAANSAKDAEDYAGSAKTALGNATLKANEAAASAGAALAHQRAANINAQNAATSAGEARDAAEQAAEQAAAQVLEKTNENAGRAEAAADRAKATEEYCDEVILDVSEMRNEISESLQEVKDYAGYAHDAYLWAQQEADRAMEYGTSLLVQEAGNDDRKVMSQDASTKAFVGRSEVISYIVQEIAKIVANAPTDFDTLKEIADYIASDKTIAAEINIMLSKHENEIRYNRNAIEKLPELVQETGDRTDAVMSQKAVTDAFVNKIFRPSGSGDAAYLSKAGGGVALIQVQYGSPIAYTLPGRNEGGTIRVGTPKYDADATPKKYVEDHFPRFRHNAYFDIYHVGDVNVSASIMFTYYSTSDAEIGHTITDFYNFIANDCDGVLACSGTLYANGASGYLYGVEAGGNMIYFNASGATSPIEVNDSDFRCDYSYEAVKQL